MTHADRALGWDVGGAYVKAAVVEATAGTRRVHGEPALRDLAGQARPAGRAARARRRAAASRHGGGDDDRGAVRRVPDQARGRQLRARRRAGRVAGAGARLHHAGRVRGAGRRARPPLDAAASNWMATAQLVGRFVPEALLVDIGSTTTDIIPVTGGRVTAVGRTDPERLVAGELLYTGALRTNVAAIVRRVPLWGGECPVASELFAISGDVHVLLGSLGTDDYTCPTPDGRPSHDGVCRGAPRPRGLRGWRHARRRRHPRHRGGRGRGPGRGRSPARSAPSPAVCRGRRP